MRDVIVETTEDKIGGGTERMHVIRALHLVHQPGSFNISVPVSIRIVCSLYVMCNQESEQEEEGLQKMHADETAQHHVPWRCREKQRQHKQVGDITGLLETERQMVANT